MKQGTNYCYEMERQREILHEEFKDMGYPELAEEALMAEGYPALTKLAERLYVLAKEKGELALANAMFFEGWIYTR